MSRVEQAAMAITVAFSLFMGLAFIGIDPVAAMFFAVASMAFTLAWQTMGKGSRRERLCGVYRFLKLSVRVVIGISVAVLIVFFLLLSGFLPKSATEDVESENVYVDPPLNGNVLIAAESDGAYASIHIPTGEIDTLIEALEEYRE